jgi:serine/threonine-protein kinase
MDSEGALHEQAQRRIGTVLCGKYTVNRVLGVGGMAVVYAATHRNLKQVAIKMLHVQLSHHAEIRKRFLREGYVANSVKHKGAVDVIDDDVAEDGAAFLVMEYLEGAPVDALAERRNGRLPPAAALVVAHELCGVLAAAHAHEIVHRDIKPANIFVTTEGELKVLDFGIARLRDSSSGQATNTGMMLGTPAFMAPEQARGQTSEIAPATDIWAAGATLFSLLSGANVHDADNAQMLMIQAATRPPRSLASVMPNLPPEIVRVVDRALKFERSERWESAAAMRTALHDAHVAAFGDFSVARTLAPLAGGTAPEGSVRPSSRSKADLGAAPTVMDAATSSGAASPAPRSSPVGATTASPVTRSSFVQPIASTKSIGLGIAVVTLLGGAVFVGLGNKQDAPKAAGSALVQATSTVAADPSPAKPSTAPEVKLAPLIPASVSASPAPGTATAAPPATSIRIPHGTKPVVDPKPPAVAAPPSSASSPAATSGPAPRPTAPIPVDPGSVR